MDEMKAVDLGQVMSTIRASGRPNTVLWQAPDSIAFVARGREFRSEFHSDPSDEVMYMIKGDMNLHYRTPEGDEKIAVIREGQIVYCPGRHAALAAILTRRVRPGARAQAPAGRERSLHVVLREVRHAAASKRQAGRRLSRGSGVARLRGVLRLGSESHV